MKTLKFIGLALLAIVMCVNFSACSNNDDDNGIEGTWGLTKDEVTYRDGHIETEEYDPFKPEENGDDDMIKIKKLSGTTYSLTSYSFRNGKWSSDDSFNYDTNTKKISGTDDEDLTNATSITIKRTSNNTLVIEYTWNPDETEDAEDNFVKDVSTYTLMPEN